MTDEGVEGWADAIEEVVAHTRFDAGLVRVFESCRSTQDPARDLGVGAVVTTGIQTDGRGRLGREWIDAEGDGIAVSLGIIPTDPAVLSIAAGLAVLETLRGFALPGTGARIGLKFPNDVVDRETGRKFAGMLVEADPSVAVLGIGVNVRTPRTEVDAPAIAIDELVSGDATPSRLVMLLDLLHRLDRVLDLDTGSLRTRYAQEHAPTGRSVQLESNGTVYEGRLESLDPFGSVTLVEAGTNTIREFTASQIRLERWQAGGRDRRLESGGGRDR